MVDHLRLDTDAVDALAATLDDVATRARLLAGRVAEAQLVGGVLGSPVARLAFVEETAALVARVLTARAGDAAALQLDPQLAVWFDGVALVQPVTADVEGPLAAYGERRVHDVLALARRAGSAHDGAPSGVALAAAFEDLTSVEVDQVVRRLSAAELRAVWRRLCRPLADGGLADDERRRLGIFLAERVDRGSWSRLAAAAPELEPALGPVAGRLDAAYLDGTAVVPVVADLQGPLAVPAPGDPAAIDDSDEHQGPLGDFYLHAALQGLAATRPELLARMLRRNANGTVTVTFADGEQVVVDPTLVTDERYARHPLLTQRSDLDDGGRGGERWAAVLEKAYAIRHGGYDAIWGGLPGRAVQELVGGTTVTLRGDDVEVGDLARRLAAGELVSLVTFGSSVPLPGRAEPLPGHHAVRIVAVDPAAGTVTLENPWFAGGSRPMVVPAAAIVAAVHEGAAVAANRVPSGPPGSADDEEHGAERKRRR